MIIPDGGLDGPVVRLALNLPLETLDVYDLCAQPLEDDSNVLDVEVRRLVERHLVHEQEELVSRLVVVVSLGL